MKPGEFDDLVRQKFDQNDFEYNPRNWEMLTEELDGQKKKNKGLLFWWMPLVGVAASVAMAFGVSTVLYDAGHRYGSAPKYAAVQKHKTAAPVRNHISSVQPEVIPAQDASGMAATPAENVHSVKVGDGNNATVATNSQNHNLLSEVDNDPVGGNSDNKISGTFNFNSAPEKDNNVLAKKKKAVVVNNGYYTFKEEEMPKKDPKIAIILSGGVNYSNKSNGYTVGATARRMINDKVYVEGDIAFIGTNNTHKVEYMVYNTGAAGTSQSLPAGMAAKSTALGKNTDNASKNTATGPVGVLKTSDETYNLYYAQVTPTIGYKLMKRMSVGVGPDFQQMLVDNRPEVNTSDRGNIRVAPIFDIGFMGKTEIAVTKNMKAAVYYREGINNVITPTNKYIDRNYLQFQVKYNILNR